MANKITVVIYGSNYWNSVLNLDTLVDKGAIAPKDRDLFQFADTPEQAFEILHAGLQDHIKTRRKDIPPPPLERAPSDQEILGPDIAKTSR